MCVTRTSCFPLVVLLAFVPALGAQQIDSLHGAVRGYVWDSLLTHAVLPRAQIMASGTAVRIVEADEHGRFVFDTLAPGRYFLSFTHPSLDQLGYTPTEVEVEIEAGKVRPVFLSTISGDAVLNAYCPAPRPSLTGVAFGRLADARTEAPIAGAEVKVEWRETTVSKTMGVLSGIRAAVATTDSLGIYRICGVPTDTPVMLRARVGSLQGPPLELDLAGRPVAFRILALDAHPPAAIVGEGATGTGTLRGVVRGPDHTGIAEAQVLVLGLPQGARTGPTGRFEITGLPAGTYSIETRAIGFTRRRDIVDLHPDRSAEVEVVLARQALVLPDVAVTERAPAVTEFDQRRRQGRAGHFMTREEIDKRHPIRAEELFRTVPGFTVVPSGGFDYAIVSSRDARASGYCQPDIYLDGTKIPVDPQQGGGLPVGPDEIYGIESYPNIANAPPQYRSTSGCGVILIWTRRGTTEPGR